MGPSELINLIRNTFFSANDRLYTLLKFIGLERRMLMRVEDVNKCIADQIDYTDVLAKVDQRRKESMKYLVNALNR